MSHHEFRVDGKASVQMVGTRSVCTKDVRARARTSVEVTFQKENCSTRLENEHGGWGDGDDGMRLGNGILRHGRESSIAWYQDRSPGKVSSSAFHEN